MGIQGLLPFLKSIQRPSHIKEWAGQTLAIDTYSWLHKAAYGCAQELCLGLRTTRHIDYVMARVDLLRHHGVIPYVVFDGDALPGKRGTEELREKRRQQHLSIAKNLLAKGKKEEAREEFVKAADITPQLAHDVIISLQKAGVKYVVAPYEADAQLRFLELNGDVAGIITEDSDLLVFGTNNCIFKLDAFGHCIHICRDDFGKVADAQMSLWTDTEFRQMAILSGCDYLPSIPGLGLKKAYQLIRTYKSAERAIKATRLEGNMKVPLKYEALFRRAELTFLYQIVYNPTTRKLVHLHPLPSPPPTSEDLVDCGEMWEDDLAVAVAEGRIDPLTKTVFKPSINVLPSTSATCFQLPRTSQKSRALPKSTSVPSNQRTLNSFSFTPSPVVKNESHLISSDTHGVLHPIENLSVQSTLSSSSQQHLGSKFFDTKPKASEENSVSLLAVRLPSEHALPLDELVPEDAEPLSQEAWSELSETGGSEDMHLMMGPDWASSQLQEEDISLLGKLLPDLPTQSQSVSESSPLTSPAVVHTSDSLSFCDGVLSSPVRDESDRIGNFAAPHVTKSKITLKSESSSILFNASPTNNPASMSSDPILEDEDEILVDQPNRLSVGSNLKRSHQTKTPVTLKKQKSRPVVQESFKLRGGMDEEISPSLARIASGMHERFTFRTLTPLQRRNGSGNRKTSMTPINRTGASVSRPEDHETPTIAPVIQRRHTDIVSRHSNETQTHSNNSYEQDRITSPVVAAPKLAAFLFKRPPDSR